MRELLAFRRRQLRMRLEVIGARAGVPLAWAWAARAEFLVASAALGGWASITLAIARIGAPDIVWPLSIGLALLSICGWSWLRTLVTLGLYTLTRAAPSRRG